MSFLFTPITTNIVLNFVIGLLSVFPSLAPTALSIKRDSSCEMRNKAKLEDKFLYIPIFYGILSVIIFGIVSMFLPKQYQKYWVIGLIIGVLYPTLGWLNRLPQDVYGTTNIYTFYLSAIVLYTIFYGVIISFTASRICY